MPLARQAVALVASGYWAPAGSLPAVHGERASRSFPLQFLNGAHGRSRRMSRKKVRPAAMETIACLLAMGPLTWGRGADL